ncbi:MAG: uracil-DNA glycosylase [Patescibacteria group bacterium]|jgi:DNA polymerase|nr:uracil-DNA glycosylase [Patescibacteria group bacterium]
MNKQELLDQIKADIVKDNVCPDLAQNAKNLVFGDGNPNAEIMFIGEAPGRQEDDQGLPFVGASGKFLSEMLASIHLKREQVYITNIVKYRPPNNRDPEPQEKLDFLPYLLRQIQIINPLIVVTLGRHPMSMFLPKAKISEVHGQPIRVGIGDKELGNGDGKIVILPLYHPAAALYNGSMRKVLQEDFSQIPEILALIRKGN